MDPRQPERPARRPGATLALLAAAALVALSTLLPYWELRFDSASASRTLRLAAYLHTVEGPVSELLREAGGGLADHGLALSRLQHSLAVAAGLVVSLLLATAAVVHRPRTGLLALPALAFPLVVAADTTRWLRPVVDALCASHAVAAPGPFFVGTVELADGSLASWPGAGLLLAAAAALCVAGVLLPRRTVRTG